MINGFDIQMKCVGEECNSNGIWPFDFEIAIDKVRQTDEKTTFLFTHKINRGWTPSHGGGKALNQKMQFNVTLPLKFFFFNNNTASVNHVMLNQNLPLTDKAQYPYNDVYSPVFPKDFDGNTMITGINHL